MKSFISQHLKWKICVIYYHTSKPNHEKNSTGCWLHEKRGIQSGADNSLAMFWTSWTVPETSSLIMKEWWQDTWKGREKSLKSEHQRTVWFLPNTRSMTAYKKCRKRKCTVIKITIDAHKVQRSRNTSKHKRLHLQGHNGLNYLLMLEMIFLWELLSMCDQIIQMSPGKW